MVKCHQLRFISLVKLSTFMTTSVLELAATPSYDKINVLGLAATPSFDNMYVLGLAATPSFEATSHIHIIIKLAGW